MYMPTPGSPDDESSTSMAALLWFRMPFFLLGTFLLLVAPNVLLRMVGLLLVSISIFLDSNLLEKIGLSIYVLFGIAVILYLVFLPMLNN